MGKGDISGWLLSPGVAPRGGRIPLAAEKRRGRFTVLNNSKWVGSSVHREEGCSLWERFQGSFLSVGLSPFPHLPGADRLWRTEQPGRLVCPDKRQVRA